MTTDMDGTADLAGSNGRSTPLEAGATVILIVTPTYNSEKFLDDTILSVVSQPGNFHLRYHIQDGGSRDGTMTIVRRWERLLRSRDFPILCAGIAFSYDSNPDTGMYQAINRGVAHARPDRPFVMGWINSDDRLAPGALAAIDGIYRQFADVSFTCARVSMIDRDGVITGVNLPLAYDRQKLSEGAHDGRRASFVMQEGTFWRSALWDQVGGLDERFRLAGDWDLWRRFARYAALVTVDSVLGFHRRHDHQLSADLDRYHAEVDAVGADLTPPLGIAANAMSETLKFDLGTRQWVRTKRSGTGPATPVVHLASEAAAATFPVELTAGARMPEGPYPEVNLPGGMRWIDDVRAEAVVSVPYPGRWQMHLRIRNWRPDLNLRVVRGTAVALDVMPRAGDDDSDTLLVASLWLEGGRNAIGLESAGRFDPAGGWLFVVLEWYVLDVPTREPARPAPRGLTDCTNAAPTISIVMVASSAGTRLDLRLDALLAQAYPECDITVVDDQVSSETRQILSKYAPVLDRVVAVGGDDRQTVIGRAINRTSGTLVVVLDEMTTLAPGALSAFAEASRRDHPGDLIVGVTVDEHLSTPVTRHLPALPDGPLVVRDLLRAGLRLAAIDLFDRGVLLFTRRVWEAAGGNLAAATSGHAAFDFWLRCARIGATLLTLPFDLVRRAVDGDRLRGERTDRDLRRHAAALAHDEGLTSGREASIAARSALKIVMLDAAGIRARPSGDCRRLAAALATANQRVVCLVNDDQPSGGTQPGDAAAILGAILSECPDLVVIVGDRPDLRCRDVVAKLVAGNTPTINFRRNRAKRKDLRAINPPSDSLVAIPYRVLIYGANGLREGVDTSLYRPNRREEARRILGLPADVFIVLAVADELSAPSSQLVTTIEAYEQLANDAKLLIVLGYDGELPPTAAPLQRADDAEAADLQMLYFAAVDAVVSTLGDDDEVVLVQAAASGTPAIVRGDGKTKGDRLTGLRLPEWTAPLLADALARLRDDGGLQPRSAAPVVADAQVKHSLAASGWSFMTLLSRLPGFQRLRLPTEVHFPVAAPVVALRPLQSARARPLLLPSWQPTSPPYATLTGGRSGIELPEGTTSYYVRALHGGPQRLRVRLAGCDVGRRVTAVVNGVDHATPDSVLLDDGDVSYFLRAPFLNGVNRVDLSVLSKSGAASRLQSLDFGDECATIDGLAGRWEPLIGFVEVDPVDGPGPPRRWLDGPSATLRLWANAAGPRLLCLSLKNYGEPQAVAVTVNGGDVGSIDAPTTDFLTSIKAVLPVTLEPGWNIVALAILCPDRPSSRRRLWLLVADVRQAAIDDRHFLSDDDHRPSDLP